MVDINIQNLGKRFYNDWVFRQLNSQLKTNSATAIVGANGSGKTTLLKIIAGMTLPTSGNVHYQVNKKNIPADSIFKYISLAAPYIETIEEYTLYEFLTFHFSFKPIKNGMTINDIIFKLGLERARNKYIQHFSSGMKQKLKLGITFYADTPILLLDEPTANLDTKSIVWYQEEIKDVLKDRLVLISSNQSYEYDICNHHINLEEYKRS